MSRRRLVDGLPEATADPALLDDVEAMAVGGQQHGMVTLDEAGELVRDALLWNDNRSAAGRGRPDRSSSAGPRPGPRRSAPYRWPR